ncbi:hypothetical protein [Ralstonia pseudosolanacearum]
MTVFNFITVGKTLDVDLPFVEKVQSEQEADAVELGEGIKSSQSTSLQDRLYVHTSQAIQFLQYNYLVPPLAPQVDVVFTNVSLKEKIGKVINSLLGRGLEQYQHNACADPETSTIYFSSAYLALKEKLPAEIQILALELGTVQKVVERELFHEIGHLAIRKHLRRKEVDSSIHPFEQRIRENIEEGFADSFSLHMMAIKYPDQQSFPVLRRHIQEQVKNDPFQVINVYRAYDDIPLKDSNGTVLKDVNQIVAGCLEVALKNNKAMLLECLADNFYRPQIKGSLNLKLSDSIDDGAYVDHFHNHYRKEGIVVNIKDARAKHFGSNANTAKKKV